MNGWLSFLGWMVAGFVGLELLSYVLHRWIFHGLLWKIHITHHTKQHGPFEWNDLFSVFFTALTIGLLAWGFSDPVGSVAFPVGLGMTTYGVLYFLIHDLITHRRFWPMRAKTAWVDTVRRAHLAHHQSIEKVGREPFGLFLFPYGQFAKPRSKDSVPTVGKDSD